MAYDSTGTDNLADFLMPQSAQANNVGAKFWSLQTDDAESVVGASGYFNSVYQVLTVGDMIWCETASGGTPLWYWVKIIGITSAGVVTTDSHAVVFT